MKYIHQSCLEEWLKVSGKTQCDICHYKYHFQPVYAENAPARLGLLDASRIILKRLVHRVIWQIRVILAVFAWVIWVPFVTSWTWRLYLNPSGMFEQQPSSSGSRKPVYSTALGNYLELPQSIVRLLESVEMLTDWRFLFKRLASEVFEGQIIAVVVIVLGLCVLLLREYIVHLIQEQEANDRLRGRRRRPAPMAAPRPAHRLPPRPLAFEENRPERLAAQVNLLQNALLENLENEPDEDRVEQIRNFAQRAKDLLEMEEALRRNQNRIPPASPLDSQTEQPDTSPTRLEPPRNIPSHEIQGSSRDTRPISSDSIAMRTRSQSRRMSNKSNVSEASNEQPSPAVEILKYNLRSRRSSQDIDVHEWFSSAGSSVEPKKSPPVDTPSDQEMKEQLVKDLQDLDTASDSSPNKAPGPISSESDMDSDVRDFIRSIHQEVRRGSEPGSESDVDTSLHEVARQMRNRLERESMAAGIPVAVGNPPLEPQPEPVRQLPNVPVRAQEEPLPNPQVNINVGIGDGEIVAQIEVNDIQGFLDLVGVNGPISKLFQNVALVHLLVFVVLGVGVWIPFMLGSVTNYFVNQVVVKSAEYVFNHGFLMVQKATDPIIEPIVDFLLIALNNTVDNSTMTNTKNSSSLSYLNTLYHVFGIQSGKNVSEGVPFGPYHPNFFQSFQEDLSSVILGYFTIALLFLIYVVIFCNPELN
jgi:E3 ubiquitin-protein ligase MARCH6